MQTFFKTKRKAVKRLRTRPKPMSAKRRKDQRVAAKVKAVVMARDGHCRLNRSVFGRCQGESTWAHLPWLRRSKTRGMAPEHRHTEEGSVALCVRHHRMLDEHEIEAIRTPLGIAWVYRKEGVA